MFMSDASGEECCCYQMLLLLLLLTWLLFATGFAPMNINAIQASSGKQEGSIVNAHANEHCTRLVGNFGAAMLLLC